MASTLRPPYNAELVEALNNIPAEGPLTLESLQQQRDEIAAQAIPTDPEIISRDLDIGTTDGAKITISIMERKANTGTNRPSVLFIHGGCFVMGTRHWAVDGQFEWVKQADVVLVTVEYRLAPEHPDPVPVEDCYTSLKWMSDNATDLGINPDQILIMGASAGGGLAAGTTLLCRDRPGPKVCAQMLIYPMLDDRVTSTSSVQYWEEGPLTGEVCRITWDWLLPKKIEGAEVSVYAAPAREHDLSGLPKTWIDIGSAETLRDECVAYASKLWKFGNDCELQVWPGAYHAFDIIAPESKITKAARDSRLLWVKNLFGV